MTLYETSLRAPMIVRAPGGKPGNVIRQPVEFLDIYPTLVSLAGLPAPTSGIGEVEGTDLAPLILSGQAVPASVVAGAAYSQVTRCRASYDNEIGPCSGEFGLKNASQFDWMGMSVRTATHRYVEWRNWSGDALAPVWAGAAVAIELYAHSAGDGGDFDSYVNGESVNIATDVASAPVVEALAAQIRTVFQPENIGVVAVPTAEAVLNAMAKVDSYFQASSDDKINGYPNNDWTGGVYMAGLMAHYRASKSASQCRHTGVTQTAGKFCETHCGNSYSFDGVCSTSSGALGLVSEPESRARNPNSSSSSSAILSTMTVQRLNSIPDEKDM